MLIIWEKLWRLAVMEEMTKTCCKQFKASKIFYQEYQDIQAETQEAFLAELCESWNIEEFQEKPGS